MPTRTLLERGPAPRSVILRITATRPGPVRTWAAAATGVSLAACGLLPLTPVAAALAVPVTVRRLRPVLPPAG